jgi:hypothetical protein
MEDDADISLKVYREEQHSFLSLKKQMLEMGNYNKYANVATSQNYIFLLGMKQIRFNQDNNVDPLKTNIIRFI